MSQIKKAFIKKRIMYMMNNAVLLLCVLVTIIAFAHSNGRNEDDGLTKNIQPTTVAELDDGSTEFFFDLSRYDYRYSGIMFYTSHSIVKAYNKGRVIYDFSHNVPRLSKTPGTGYHFVQINENMTQLAIIVTPVYSVIDTDDIEFYIGSAYEMYNDKIFRSMPRFIVSFLIVIFSIAIHLYYILMRKRQRLGKELSCLAYFSFFVGMWSLNETDVVSLLVENRTMDSLVPYFCLMLVVPPFIAFFDSYLDINNRFVKVVFIGASFIIDSVLIILHFTHISEFRENIIIIQMLLLVSLVYMIINVIIKLLRKVYTRHVIICAIGLSLFFIALLGDIFVHYNDASDSDTLGRYVFLVFVVLMAWDMIKDAYSIIEKGRRIRQMELFALTDTMTGLFNRNAFESQASVKKRLDGLVAVVADANGLKECNDTYGHEAGDEYILQVAQIFHDVYGKYGDCYRTGGDEFCCIIPAGKNLNMDHLHKVFLAKLHAANMKGQREYKMGVAIGSALYNENIDGDFRMLVKRADAKMYENKKEYKSGIA